MTSAEPEATVAEPAAETPQQEPPPQPTAGPSLVIDAMNVGELTRLIDDPTTDEPTRVRCRNKIKSLRPLRAEAYQAMDDLIKAASSVEGRLASVKETFRLRRQANLALDTEAREKNLKPMLWLSHEGLLIEPAKNWLVHGVIQDGCLGFKVGEKESFKSLDELDLFLRIAYGLPTWHGRKLNRQGHVFYVAAEGRGRFKYRAIAWQQKHGFPSPSRYFHVLPTAVDLRNPVLMAKFLEDITRIANGEPIVAVGFDTMNRCIPGANENSTQDLSEAVTACDVIREATGAFVDLCHHPRKNDEGEGHGRGSGVGLNAADTELIYKRTGDLVKVTMGKNKEGCKDAYDSLELEILELEDEHGHKLREPDSGETITGAVLNSVDAARVQVIQATLFAVDDDKVWDFVEKHPNCQMNDVRVGLRIGKHTADESLKRLLLDSRLSTSKGGRGNRADLYSVVTP